MSVGVFDLVGGGGCLRELKEPRVPGQIEGAIKKKIKKACRLPINTSIK